MVEKLPEFVLAMGLTVVGALGELEQLARATTKGRRRTRRRGSERVSMAKAGLKFLRHSHHLIPRRAREAALLRSSFVSQGANLGEQRRRESLSPRSEANRMPNVGRFTSAARFVQRVKLYRLSNIASQKCLRWATKEGELHRAGYAPAVCR